MTWSDEDIYCHFLPRAKYPSADHTHANTHKTAYRQKSWTTIFIKVVKPIISCILCN